MNQLKYHHMKNSTSREVHNWFIGNLIRYITFCCEQMQIKLEENIVGKTYWDEYILRVCILLREWITLLIDPYLY